MLGGRGVRLGVVVAIVMAVAPVANAVAQSSYRVVEIGTAPGFTATTGDDINASGQVAGTLHGGVSGEWSAFMWAPSSGLRALGDFAGEGTFGGGINDLGAVTGASAGGHVYFGQTAFRWTVAGGFQNLGPAGFPSGINNVGEVIGTALGQSWVRWDADGKVQPFGSLPYIYGSPRAINNEGQIVGWAAEGGAARLWDPQTGLGELPAFPGGFSALAYDINDLGHASGNADVPYVTKLKHGMSAPCGLRANSCAVIWRDGRPTAVGPDGSYGYGINNDDHVVGQFLDGSDAFRATAFLYRDGVFSDLNRLVPAGTPFLEEARAINDSGWILANGRGRAFVLIPR